jgi:hypothetical protein
LPGVDRHDRQPVGDHDFVGQASYGRGRRGLARSPPRLGLDDLTFACSDAAHLKVITVSWRVQQHSRLSIPLLVVAHLNHVDNAT